MLKSKTVIFFLAIIFLTGCWDLKIIEELAMITGLGIDSVEDNRDLLQITTLNPAFSEESTAPNVRKTVRGYSINQALMNLQLQRQRTLVLNKLRVIVFSDAAASDGTMHEAIRQLDQRRDMDANARIVIVKGDTAQALFNIEPPEEARMALYMDNVLNAAKNDGRIPDITIHHYWNQYNTRGIHPVLPVVEINEPKDGIVIRGLAVIDETGRMVSQLSDTEMLYYMLLTGNMSRGRFFTEVDYVLQRNRQISAMIKNVQTSVNTRIKDGKPTIDIQVKIEVDSLDINMTFEDQLNKDIFAGLEAALADSFENKMEEVVNKTQSHEADIFGLGIKVRIQNPQWFRGRDWAKDYRECKTNVKVKVTIKRIGTLINPRY